jgi:dTDP-4-amino-4,6-dideoxygalactose transaminase
LSKDTINISKIKYLPTGIRFYKKLKHFLESKCSNDPSIYNYLFKLLMQRNKNEGLNINIINNYQLKPKHIKYLYDKLGCFPSLNKKRIEVTQKIISSLNDNFSFQKVPDFGESNHNRLLLVSKNYEAEYIIKALRKKGIAANNLTQSYVNAMQPRLDYLVRFKKFIDKNTLLNYISLHDYILSVPNSPALTDRETNHIIKVLNLLV